jgi:hypothetical protein
VAETEIFEDATLALTGSCIGQQPGEGQHGGAAHGARAERRQGGVVSRRQCTDRGCVDEQDHDQGDRAERADPMISHDLERPFARRAPERICSVREGIEVHRTRQSRRQTYSEGARDELGESGNEQIGRDPAEAADRCAHEREQPRRCGHVVAPERDVTSDWNPRQERDGRERRSRR